jgi:F420-dependent oxidoreductase-like protein
MTRLGYQIPNFTYPGVGPADLFESVAAQARTADRSGFDTVLLMDHFYQLPLLGTPDQYMLECYTTLGALARETSTVRLGALVTGNTYRNPTLLAKTVTALDIASRGRAQLGIGAGWFELEHDALGFEFGTFTDRFEKLEEALQIILPMLRGERVTFAGKHYQVTDAMNEPPVVRPVPIMIGGSGEKKTLRMVAQYADESNLTSGPEELPRKLDVLAAHCQALGRDRSAVAVSQHLNACIAETHDAAEADLKRFLAGRGIDLDKADPEFAELVRARVVWGDPDDVGRRLTEIMSTGIDGMTFSLPANGHELDSIELLGTTAAKVLGLP